MARRCRVRAQLRCSADNGTSAEHRSLGRELNLLAREMALSRHTNPSR
jgi:hypothetical protein